MLTPLVVYVDESFVNILKFYVCTSAHVADFIMQKKEKKRYKSCFYGHRTEDRNEIYSEIKSEC